MEELRRWWNDGSTREKETKGEEGGDIGRKKGDWRDARDDKTRG